MGQRDRSVFEGLVRKYNRALFWSSSEKQAACLRELKEFIGKIDPDPALLSYLFSAGSPEVARLLFRIHGTSHYVVPVLHSGFTSYYQIQFLLNDGDLEMFEALNEAGFPLKRLVHDMALAAFRKDDPAYMAYCDRINGTPIKLMDTASHVTLVEKCGPNTAPRLLPELAGLDASYVMGNYQPPVKMPLKVLAVWALHGLDFSPWKKRFHSGLQWIAESSASQHGRLRLFKLEPDIEAVLGRPANHAFFGCLDPRRPSSRQG